MVVGDVLLEAVDPAERDHHREHHREAREDRAGHEVRGEDGGVPAGHDRHREVPGHDRVHREHERRREAREVQHRARVRLPLPRRPLPAECERGVDELAQARRAVAGDREVRDQADEEEHDRDRRVGRDRESVPLERRAEVHPQAALIRVRKDEVRLPHAADVDAEELRGREHREHGHRLGAAVDRVAPLRAEQVEDRADQRAGVGDADPEHEGDDVHAPEERVRVAGDAEALVDLIDPGGSRGDHERDGDVQQHDPAERDALHHSEQIAVDLGVRGLLHRAHRISDGNRRRRHRWPLRPRTRARPSRGTSRRALC